MMKIKYLVALTLLMFAAVSFSQTNQDSRRRIFGENGEVLDLEVSKSYKEENLFSEYYVDSVTRTPYTGQIKITGGPKGHTTIDIESGVQNGFKRDYTLKQGGEKELNSINYIDIDRQIRVYRIFSEKSRFNVAGAKYMNESGQNCVLSIKYGKRKMCFKEKIGRGSVKKKFETLQELQNHLNGHNFKDLFSDVGFFILSSPVR